MVADNGYQGALMVPTEVLARQHYDSIVSLMEENHFPFQVVLLTGSMTARQKREAYEKMASGEASIIVGTHALIQEKAIYHNLALVITDEQHRFGVKQREMLSKKGAAPHTIVMSATPIPRTLAVILYGDLDISVINEMPASRLPIKNCVVGTSYRKKAYEFIERQVSEGHQAYVICPMVEESEAMDAENVVAYAQVLREQLPPRITVEYLHGKMKPSEKNEIMERFLHNEIQVLVSTTVVEVGVNVPNATVMMIENAERFGLAQLHQLRGRVGRGDAQSYCIFLHTMDGKQIRERLDILCKSNDGYEIANRDMQLRGPGDLFGVRQSGMLDFALADIYTDAETLQQANEAAGDLLTQDPALVLSEHSELKKRYHLLVKQQADHLNL
jgi:ATP-dependent DNA helicase RecG